MGCKNKKHPLHAMQNLLTWETGSLKHLHYFYFNFTEKKTQQIFILKQHWKQVWMTCSWQLKENENSVLEWKVSHSLKHWHIQYLSYFTVTI